MTTQTQFRPLLTGEEYETTFWLFRINYRWLLQRLPIVLFAIVSSYGVGHLLSISGIPSPFEYIGSISFDIAFLGIIVMSEMQLSNTLKSTVIYYAMNILMSGLGALFNVLSLSDGRYANITAEHITVGIPFAICGLAYALYYHNIMSQYIQKELDNTAQNILSKEKTKEPCKFCGDGFPSKNAVYGHYNSCDMRKMHNKLNDPTKCICNLCRS